MTHDDVVSLIERDPAAHLPGEARLHVAACAECAALVAAVAAARADDAADDVPPGYWESFDARVLRRVARPRVSGRRAAWFAAAATLGVVVLSAWALRRGVEAPPAPRAPALALAEAAAEDPEAMLAVARTLLAGSTSESLDELEPLLETGGTDDDFSSFGEPLVDPVGAVVDELGDLDADAMRELAQALRTETAS